MDGTGAKYAAWKKFKDKAEYIPVNYGQEPPIIESKSDVYIVDFSYPKEFLRELAARSSKLVVLDHHLTAKNQLEGEPYAIFNMNKSGAVLAWEYFHPGVKTPKILEHIQDRDLWAWKLPDTKHILNALEVYGDDVTKWDDIANVHIKFVEVGRAISVYHDDYIKSLLKNNLVKFTEFRGHRIAITNTSILNSEVGNSLCALPNVDFAMSWAVSGSGKVSLSLRSQGNFDVSKIAESLGGGGHKTAARARVDFDFIKALYNE